MQPVHQDGKELMRVLLLHRRETVTQSSDPHLETLYKTRYDKNSFIRLLLGFVLKKLVFKI